MKSKRCLPSKAGLFALISLLVPLVTGGCAAVQPWERGRLAQPSMALDEDPLLTSISEHIYSSKEAASGGTGTAGGGCGCN